MKRHTIILAIAIALCTIGIFKLSSFPERGWRATIVAALTGSCIAAFSKWNFQVP